MSSKSILTPFQKDVFLAVIEEKLIHDNFYFSGGTALAEFYLQHRYSKDLDFFTDEEFSYRPILAMLKPKMDKLGVESFETRSAGGTKLFFLKKADQTKLKVEFTYFPFKRLKKGKEFKGVAVDSLFDITVNKLNAILSRRHARDYIDFYFILKDETFSWEEIINGVKKKFSWQIDPLNLAARLSQIDKLHDYPKMIKQFSRVKMLDFYEDQAAKLNKEIFEE